MINNKLTYSLLTLMAMSGFSSCSEDDLVDYSKGDIEPEKELISFTGESGSPVTRASGFGGSATTQIVMRIKSEDTQAKNPDGSDHTAGATRYTRTVATATPTCSSAHNGITLAGTHSDVTFTGENLRYWDDAYGRYGKLSVYAVAIPGNSTDEVLAPTTLAVGTTTSFVNGTKWFTETTENEKFTWSLSLDQSAADFVAKKDITFSNNIRLSTEDYPIKDSEEGVYRPAYSTGSTAWSYNLEKGQMQWNAQSSGSTVGKFDQGHLVFYHALSKVTINLIEATNTVEDGVIKVNKGFDNSSNEDFQFATGTNVTLLNFPYENQFDLANGQWSAYGADTNKKGNITKLHETTTTFSNITTHTMVGLVVPGKNLYEDTSNSLRFVIDGNEYFVTGKQIAEAIRTYYAEDGAHASDANAASYRQFTTMKQGEHYEINITVAKTKIDAITAQLVDWEKVTADISEPSNAYVKIQVEERASTSSQYKEYVSNGYSFDIYRAAEIAALNTTVSGEDGYYNGIAKYGWKTGYVAGEASAASDKASKSYANNTWSTKWVWPNNQTYYHFRMVGNTEGSSTSPSNVSIKKDETNGDYFGITSGKINGSNYKDYTWAAPFLKNEGEKWNYESEKYGFDGKKTDVEADPAKHQIYKAIGATTDKINLMMFHMTSQIFLNVRTTTDDAKVELSNSSKETKVELLHFYKDGTVRVGNGLVMPTTTALTENDELEFVKFNAEVAASGTESAKAAYSEFRYGVVPQALSGTDSETAYTVGIRITTPDGNQYVVEDISTVKVEASAITSVNLNNPYTATDDKYKIDRWYPGYQYTYTVTVKKTGIVNITAQLVDWETVTGDLGEITLEDKD